MANRQWTKATLLGRLAETVEEVTGGQVKAIDVLLGKESEALGTLTAAELIEMVRQAIVAEQLSRFTSPSQ